MSGFRDFPSHGNKPHFFKIFFPELTGNELRIPPAFFKHIYIGSHGMALLTGPSGNVWNVELVRDARGMSLQSGWKDFVADNFISPNDFLLFRYEGDLRFTVMIFDLTACEKEAAFLATPSRDLRPLRDGGTMAITDGLYSRKLHDGSVSLIKKEEMQFPLTFDLPKVSGGISKERYTVHEPQKTFNRKTPGKQSYKRQDSPYGRQGDYSIKARLENIISKRRSVTEEEIKRAYEAANSFQSDNPTALVVMQSSYVYYGFYMNLPISFVRDHLPKDTQNIKLWNANEDSWTVSYIYYNGRGGFSAHWGAFSQANKLERDDVCVFELINKNEMRVHVFRVVELTLLSQELQTSCASLAGQSSICQNNDTENGSLPKKPEVSVMDQKLHAETAISLPAKSKKLQFAVTLKQYNISPHKKTYLRIPYTFEALDDLVDKDRVILTDEKGNSWKVNLRRQHIKNRLSVRFADGWQALCLDNKVEEGDICIFELISKGDIPEMHVKIHKKQATFRIFYRSRPSHLGGIIPDYG